ncbi:MAG: glycosyltransferase family 2 protein [Polaromonas sp.]|uniref:glycosyltransferase family A protein n=1 Tax=Polaromonas sp. TaxID=1869339 RepID=UPI0017CB636A|nr:glycosyltransferase family A protein [Polaromonas sp.]NMM11430.1 glycosyltransferase family 2 protein [Polaromonas sp.]
MCESLKYPFFSIVIPTKGRPDLLQDAISSVLRQDFSDYELIVSDNFNDNRTRKVVELFKGNSSIRYFRTECELNMPLHWEFATKKTLGKYVLILTDRSVLKQHALTTIHKELVDHPEVAICSWRWSLYDAKNGIEFYKTIDQRLQEVEILPTSFVARDFVRKSTNYPYSLPRGLNSCYRADLAEHVREKHGALFLPISPDYSSAFLLLAYAPSIIHINKSLFISQGLAVSNGGNAMASNGDSYLNTLNLPDPYKYVPIKRFIVESGIFSDFLMVKEITNGNLANVEMDWEEYFVACYREIYEKISRNVLNKTAIAKIVLSWDLALKNSNTNIQINVKRRLRRFKLLVVLKRSMFGPPLLYIKHSVKALRSVGRQPDHKTVIEAAGFRIEIKK